MPKYKCPFPECTYETADVEDALAAVLISVHSNGTHVAAPTNSPHTNAAKIERVKRPTISAAGSSEEWTYFLTRWQEYVDATQITGKDKVLQLLECCDDNLRKDITRNAGGSLANKTGEQVHAVHEENAMVARVQLSDIKQDRDEAIRNFGARLRGQASVCKFTTACPSCNTAVNYTDNILRDILIKGLADNEIQLDLLGDKNQDMSLEEVFQFVEAKEAAKRSVGLLLQSQGAEAIRSQYRKTRQEEVKQNAVRADPPKDKNELCSYCGQRGHGKNAPTKVRKAECPAYGKSCGHCGRHNHLATVCRGKNKPPPTRLQLESAIFDSLCNLNISTPQPAQHSAALHLDHHLFHSPHERWIQQPSQTQPFLALTATAHPDGYRALGLKQVISKPHTAKLTAMADTGC